MTPAIHVLRATEDQRDRLARVADTVREEYPTEAARYDERVKALGAMGDAVQAYLEGHGTKQQVHEAFYQLGQVDKADLRRASYTLITAAGSAA